MICGSDFNPVEKQDVRSVEKQRCADVEKQDCGVVKAPNSVFSLSPL
jgi:hypothetical protein